jgi:hypothetical protein
MNNLLKRFVVMACIGIVMMCAHGISHAQTFYRNNVHPDRFFSTVDAACIDGMTNYPGRTYSGFNANVSNNYICLGKASPNSPDGALFGVSTQSCPTSQVFIPSTGTCGASPPPPPTDCPAGLHLHLTTVTGGGTISACQRGPSPCPDGQTHLDNMCVIPACPAGQHRDLLGNCVPDPVNCPGGGVAQDAASCKKLVCPSGDTIQNNQCIPPQDSIPQITNPMNGCPSGTINVGTASDGTPMCKSIKVDTPLVDNTPKVTEKPPTTVDNGDGTQTTTTQSSAQNSDGSTTTKTTTCTTASDGNTTCQTGITTGANSSGGSGKSDGGLGGSGGGTGSGKGTGATDDQSDLCAKHPHLNICSNSQVTGGACSGMVSTTACTGDAIQCGMLRQMRDENCANSKDTPSSILGNQMMNGNDPMQKSLPSKANGTTVNGANSIDQTGFLGGGSCWNDQQFPLGDSTVTIPFSNVCPYLLPLRAAIMLAALIAAYFMLSGAILRE